MHFVVVKTGIDARKEASGVVIHTLELSDEADTRFYHNPEGDADFSARCVPALAGMSNYPTRAAPCGSDKNPLSQNVQNECRYDLVRWMRLFLLPALLLFACAPVPGFAATSLPWQNTPPPAEPAAAPEDVQEPESDDASTPDAVYEPQPAVEPAPTTTTPAVGTPAAPTPPGSTPPITPPSPPAETGSADYNLVTLQGLNKVTAHTQTLEVTIGSVVRYGTIDIIAHKCWKSAPDERPENAALLEVSELKQGEAPQRIFSGWMFSSNPGISSLEHPFYDVSVVACKKSKY